MGQIKILKQEDRLTPFPYYYETTLFESCNN